MASAESKKSQEILEMVNKTLKGKWPEHPTNWRLAQLLLNLPIKKPAIKLPVSTK